MSSGSGSSSSSPTKPQHPSSRRQHLRPPLQNHHHQAQQDEGRQQQQPPLPSRPSSPRLPPPAPALLLTIRFSTSIPDLHLDIPRPSTTSVVALKHLIRTRLEEPTSQRRLRFIQAGRILPDQAVLSSVLRIPAPPPPAGTADPKGKGKAVEGAGAPQQRVYVNCSIGDSLTDDELAEEARAAAAPATGDLLPAPSSSPAAPSATRGHAAANGKSRGGGGGGRTAGTSSPPASATETTTAGARRRAGAGASGGGPRGFDRLLSAGFTPAEVNQLRLQFRSIHAARHTPDTMPSPDALRGMEEAWMDSQGGGLGGGGGGGGVSSGFGDDLDGAGGGRGGTDGGDDVGLNGVLDVLLRGMLIGFVWPLASVGWLVREEGLYSRRWKIFVSLGFALSLAIGVIRYFSGGDR